MVITTTEGTIHHICHVLIRRYNKITGMNIMIQIINRNKKILITLIHKIEIMNRFNQYAQNQTFCSNESKQRRAKHRNNSTPFYSTNNRQRRIDQAPDNESFYRNDRRSQLRQVKSNSTQSVFNEFDDSEDGRINPRNNGYFRERNNTGVRNFSNFEDSRRNLLSNGYNIRRNNTSVRNSYNYESDRKNSMNNGYNVGKNNTGVGDFENKMIRNISL